MASVFKRGRWVDASGRKCTKTAPHARYVESRFYTVAYCLPGGKIRRVKGYTDRAASEQLRAKLERAKARGEQDLIDVYAPHRKRPVSEHVKDYIADLRAMGRAGKYLDNIDRRLNKLVKSCKWNALTDVTADSFIAWRRGIALDDDGRAVIGPVTQNQYLEAARGFCRWMVKPAKRMPLNPLTDVEKVDESTDVRRARRALTAEQVADLLDAVAEHHKPLYRFVLATGLRRSELAALQWGDVHADATTPYVKLRTKATKSRRADSLPLRVDLADELRRLRGDAGDADKVFSSVPTIEEHRDYLTAAGIPWEDEEGRRADVHALRHTYGTLLSKAGVSPREATELMHHTDMRLTMQIYTDPCIFGLAGAVSKLPLPAAEPVVVAATATDGGAGRRESGTSPSAPINHPTAETGRGKVPSDQSQASANGELRRGAARIVKNSPFVTHFIKFLSPRFHKHADEWVRANFTRE